MPLISRKTEEEKAAKAAQKEANREAKAREKLKRAFFTSPAGEARVAFENGAQVFQYEADVRSMRAVVKPLFMGSSAMGVQTGVGRGPVETLNAVCGEGWKLLNGSFVFVETGQQSRSKALSSGQQVAISGSVVGYYLFKRNEANKAYDRRDPWEASDEEAVALADQVEE